MEERLKGFNKKRAILFIIFSIILSRLLIFAVYYIFFNNEASFAEKLQFADATRYIQIMNEGYNSPIDNAQGLSSYAFFPLYPLLLKIINTIIPINIAILAFIVSSIITGLALYISCKYLYITRGNSKIGYLFVVLMTFGAYSIYNSLFYTESLFFLLLISGLYFLEDKKYLYAGICGALLSATKLVGSLFVFAIITKYIIEFFKNKKINLTTIKELVKKILKDEAFLLSIVIVPVGLAMYMICLNNIVQDPFAFIRAHKAWGRQIDSLGLFHIFYALFNYRYNTEVFAYAVLNIFCIVLTAMSIEKYKIEECILCFLFTFTILSQGELYSIGRFITGFVVYIFTLADLLISSKKPVIFIGTTIWSIIGIYGTYLVFYNSSTMF